MADQAKGGPTAVLYKGRQYPLGTKKADLEKMHEKRLKEESEAKQGGQYWSEFQIPGTSGSGEPQPDKGGVINDEKSAAKGAKEADKEADKSTAKK